MDELDPDILMIFEQRVHQIAGVLGKKVKVYLNDALINYPTFKDYCLLFLKDQTEVVEFNVKRWNVVACPSSGQFQQLSFVNMLHTSKGGSHVKYVLD